MTFNAIFDESGTHGDSNLIVFAGFIADQHECEALTPEWAQRLERFDRSGKWFHMVEANRRYLRSTDENERQSLESLVSDLATIACDRMTEGVINSITTADFSALPQDQRKKYKNPFYYAFEAGILKRARASESPGDNLNLICDDSDEHAAKCLDAFKWLKRHHPEVEEKLPMISFCDDRFWPPLQAADLFAYCYRQERCNALQGLWVKPLELFKATFSEVERSDIRVANGDVV